ncbi:sialidase family protein [Fibrisoma montanum]|nr:sialidase family protein [Fibrisoma montanum]
MMWLISFVVSIVSFLTTQHLPFEVSERVASCHLPVVVSDETGMVHLVYGQDSTIFYAVATKKRAQFSQPVAITTLSQLVAGAKRGPQIASTEKYVVITAVNRAGNLFAYSLDRKSGRWSSAVRINDVPEVAKEGFQAIASASPNVFQATWLDLRADKRNKIVMATSRDGGRTWSANRVVYRSPSGTVCECCKVSIAAKDNNVYIQFRNWLNSSRDLYLSHSADGGATFAPAQKLGSGTWQLNACPMDGGAVTLSSSGQPLTVWRRERTLFTCRPGQSEQAIGTGRNVTASTSPSDTAVVWDDDGMVWLKRNSNDPINLGKGQLPSVALTNQSAVCVWEMDGQVMTTTVHL